jgi:hypothetical protein
MTNTAWKNTERRVAAILGGERVPVTGRQRGSAPDIAHPSLAIEVKHRAILPAWIRDAMDQAQASVRGEQLPIVVLHQAGDRFASSFVVLELSDFSTLFNSYEEKIGR